jgi:hypothetical protein
MDAGRCFCRGWCCCGTCSSCCCCRDDARISLTPPLGGDELLVPLLGPHRRLGGLLHQLGVRWQPVRGLRVSLVGQQTGDDALEVLDGGPARRGRTLATPGSRPRAPKRIGRGRRVGSESSTRPGPQSTCPRAPSSTHPTPTHPTSTKPKEVRSPFFPYPEVVLLRKFFSPLHTLTPHTQSHIHYEYPFQGSLWSLLILSSGLCCVCGWVDSFEAPRSKSARGEAFGVPPLLHLLFWPGCWSHALTPPPPFTPTTHTGTAPGQLGETRGTGKHDAWLGEEGWGTGEDDDASPSGYAFR